MKELIEQTRAYLDYVQRHFINVNKAWDELNIKCKKKDFNWLTDDFIWNEINQNIKIHDMSKLSENEFTQYRQRFFPTPYEKNNNIVTKETFDSAWQHHLGNNPHHWQNWTERDYANPNQSLIYFIENICDWMAMGYEFGDTAKDYYENNKSKIDLPEWAVKHMYEIFECLGYE